MNSGNLPKPYIELGASWVDGPSAVRDPEIERIERETASTSAPAPPLPPPELSKTGKAITKKEKKAVCCFPILCEIKSHRASAAERENGWERLVRPPCAARVRASSFIPRGGGATFAQPTRPQTFLQKGRRRGQRNQGSAEILCSVSFPIFQLESV